MNRQFTIYKRLATTAPPNVVFDAVEQALRTGVGGSISRDANTFRIFNGANNVNFSFVAEVNAEVALTQPSAGVVEINGTITLTPNTFFWIMGIAGLFCLWFLWIFNILFFVMDPRPSYQTALERVQLPGTNVPYGS